MALVPLALGFVGAVVVDRAFDDRAEAAPPDALVPTQDPGVAPVGTNAHTIAEAPAPAAAGAPDHLAGTPVLVPRAPDGLDWKSAHVEGDHVVAALAGKKAVLTREPALDKRLQDFLDDVVRAPYAATVVLEPSTGRVLGVAESSTRGDANGLAFKPIARAASVFKIVTTSALLEAGVSPGDSVCIHGGKTRMKPALLVDDRRRDHMCTTLTEAVAHSRNVAIAKLALAHLEPRTLRAMAERWGFQEPLPIDVDVDGPVEESPAAIPDDPFGFANAAAGFGEVRLSALHGAVLAAVVANGGVLVPPQLVDDVEGGAAPRPAPPRRVLDRRVAAALQKMMRATVAEGTARRSFHQAPHLDVDAAGKTGSLTDYSTGLEATWFVGYAPADHPEVAVASVVVNTNLWHQRAPYTAKEALRAYFALHPPAARSAVVAAR